MSDVQSPERPGKFKRFIRGCRTAIGTMSWVFPFIIMGGSFYLFPPMRSVIAIDGSVPHDVFFGLFITLGVVGLWLGYEFWYAVSRNTTATQLQLDGFVSTFFAIVLTGLALRWITLGTLPYWYVLPWVGTMLDALISGVLGINNAAQKPIVQNERG